MSIVTEEFDISTTERAEIEKRGMDVLHPAKKLYDFKELPDEEEDKLWSSATRPLTADERKKLLSLVI